MPPRWGRWNTLKFTLNNAVWLGTGRYREDTPGSKSAEGNLVGVRPPLPAPRISCLQPREPHKRSWLCLKQTGNMLIEKKRDYRYETSDFVFSDTTELLVRQSVSPLDV